MDDPNSFSRFTKTNLSFQEIYKTNAKFSQFVLDPSSFNLKERVHLKDLILGSLFKLSRDYCRGVNATRVKIFKTRASMETFPILLIEGVKTTQHYLDLND